MRLIKIAFDDINDITLTSAPKHEKFSGDGLKGFDFSSAPLKPIYKRILTGQTFSTFFV